MIIYVVTHFLITTQQRKKNKNKRLLEEIKKKYITVRIGHSGTHKIAKDWLRKFKKYKD